VGFFHDAAPFRSQTRGATLQPSGTFLFNLFPFLSRSLTALFLTCLPTARPLPRVALPLVTLVVSPPVSLAPSLPLRLDDSPPSLALGHAPFPAWSWGVTRRRLASRSGMRRSTPHARRHSDPLTEGRVFSRRCALLLTNASATSQPPGAFYLFISFSLSFADCSPLSHIPILLVPCHASRRVARRVPRPQPSSAIRHLPPLALGQPPLPPLVLGRDATSSRVSFGMRRSTPHAPRRSLFQFFFSGSSYFFFR
jgi:hypothetical protein